MKKTHASWFGRSGSAGGAAEESDDGGGGGWVVVVVVVSQPLGLDRLSPAAEAAKVAG
jgi:hypothetical protein